MNSSSSLPVRKQQNLEALIFVAYRIIYIYFCNYRYRDKWFPRRSSRKTGLRVLQIKSHTTSTVFVDEVTTRVASFCSDRFTFYLLRAHRLILEDFHVALLSLNPVQLEHNVWHDFVFKRQYFKNCPLNKLAAGKLQSCLSLRICLTNCSACSMAEAVQSTHRGQDRFECRASTVGFSFPFLPTFGLRQLFQWLCFVVGVSFSRPTFQGFTNRAKDSFRATLQAT